MKRAWIVGLLLAVMGSWAPRVAGADEVSAADAQAIQEVVRWQLEAFAADDAERAFGLATSAARNELGSADNFLQLIKDQYPPIYRNRLALFSKPEMIDGHMLVMVRLTDPDNSVWLAIYEVQREADGKWKIDSCNLLETTTISV